MAEFLRQKIGRARFDAVMTYLYSPKHELSPQQLLKQQPLAQEFKELLLGDLREKSKKETANATAVDEGK